MLPYLLTYLLTVFVFYAGEGGQDQDHLFGAKDDLLGYPSMASRKTLASTKIQKEINIDLDGLQ